MMQDNFVKRIAIYPDHLIQLRMVMSILSKGLRMFDEIVILIVTIPTRFIFYSGRKNGNDSRNIQDTKTSGGCYSGLLVDY